MVGRASIPAAVKGRDNSIALTEVRELLEQARLRAGGGLGLAIVGGGAGRGGTRWTRCGSGGR